MLRKAAQGFGLAGSCEHGDGPSDSIKDVLLLTTRLNADFKNDFSMELGSFNTSELRFEASVYRVFQKSPYRKARYENHLPLKYCITKIVQNVYHSVSIHLQQRSTTQLTMVVHTF
jgi:formyltetrahydrofolate synthetase